MGDMLLDVGVSLYEFLNQKLLFVNPDNTKVFIRTPKTANMSIAVILKENGWKETHHKDVNLYNFTNKQTYAVIREPVDRFISAFCFAVHVPAIRNRILTQLRSSKHTNITNLDYHFFPQKQLLRRIRADFSTINFFKYSDNIVSDIVDCLHLKSTHTPMLNARSIDITLSTSIKKQIADIYESDIRFYNNIEFVNK